MTFRLTSAFVAIVVLCISGILWSLWQSIEAEKTFHAEMLVMDIICCYIEGKGQWPKDWEELRTVHPSSDSMWDWPEDLPIIRERIAIDFDYNVNELDNATNDSFDGITAIGPTYIHDEKWLNRLKSVVAVHFPEK